MPWVPARHITPRALGIWLAYGLAQAVLNRGFGPHQPHHRGNAPRQSTPSRTRFFLPAVAASHLPGRCPPASPRLFYLEMTMTPKTLILDFIAALALFTILGGLPLILWGLQ